MTKTLVIFQYRQHCQSHIWQQETGYPPPPSFNYLILWNG